MYYVERNGKQLSDCFDTKEKAKEDFWYRTQWDGQTGCDCLDEFAKANPCNCEDLCESVCDEIIGDFSCECLPSGTEYVEMD